MTRSIHGGRHELGQNFLTHTPTINKVTALTAATRGAILELGAGDGALTRPLARLGRPLTAIDIDENRVAKLQNKFPLVNVLQGDALEIPFDQPVIVGNVPFNITTPILRRLLSTGTWTDAVLLTQWEVARKRCGVGGSTMMTAQSMPWFTFVLHGRVPSWGFEPRPSVDGGVFQISRRADPLISTSQKTVYERFVGEVFTGRGGTFDRIIANVAQVPLRQAKAILKRNGIAERALPRSLSPQQWAGLWEEVAVKTNTRHEGRPM